MANTGYTNPMRSFERRMSPDYAAREFRNPALRTMRSSQQLRRESGLGSLKHTMPHLRPGAMQSGGPISQIYAGSHPNLYNPDQQERNVLATGRKMASQFTNPAFRAPVGSGAGFADGGEAEEDGAPGLEELMEGDDNLSGPEQQQKQIVIEAMLALEGRHPDPERALQAFVQAFGQDALGELQQMIRQVHGQGEEEEEEPDEGEEEPDEADDIARAGGGLLSGPGSGQSDEIEGTTPTGRPVLLSDGEYVIDAPTVAALGDGSTNAGARRLDEFRRKVRKSAYGHDKQAKPMKNGGRTIMVEFGGG